MPRRESPRVGENGLAVTAAVSAVSMTLTAALALDDDAVVLRQLAKPSRSSRRSAGQAPQDDRPPGVIFIQIDGLGHPVLQRAIRDGNAPTKLSDANAR